MIECNTWRDFGHANDNIGALYARSEEKQSVYGNPLWETFTIQSRRGVHEFPLYHDAKGFIDENYDMLRGPECSVYAPRPYFTGIFCEGEGA